MYLLLLSYKNTGTSYYFRNKKTFLHMSAYFTNHQ